MDMMLVLGILAAIFFISLVTICIYRDSINIKVGNLIFIIVDIIFYFIWNLGMYEKGWLNDGYETLENISPLIFTVIPLTLIMNDKVKDYAFSAIALLWVGMFIALFISPEYIYIFDFKTDANILYVGEAFCHMLASLFGIYLILTGQVKANVKSLLKAMVFLYSIIFFGVFLNFCFHRRHFGMDPYGDFSIYFMDLFGTFEATFLAYLLGILVLFILGMQIGQLLNHLSKPFKPEQSSLQDSINNNAESISKDE